MINLHTRSIMRSVVISKCPSVVVEPSEPVRSTGDIKLSSYDKIFGALPMPVFFVFEHPIQEAVETIKGALSQALVHYYPIAGRLSAGATAGEDVIRCTGEGVLFVAASASCGVKDVKDWSDPSLKEDLGVFYPAPDGFRYELDPLVLMQVTVFSCGGFVVAVTWNHALGDGIGLCQFMQAIGELARGQPSPSVVPLRTEDSLRLPMPPFSTNFVQFVHTFQPSPLALLDITIPSSLIDRIKDKYSSMNSGRTCSVLEAVIAVLWRCRTRAIMSDPDALATLTFMSNARGYAGAKEGYYGNCLMVQLVTATSGAVANGDVVDLVKIIQRAKGRLPDQSDMDELRVRRCHGYDNVFITSVRNIGLEALDFGAGRPARVMAHWRERTSPPLCTACMPCSDGYNLLSLCVKEEHAGVFLQEFAKMEELICNPVSASSSKL